MKYHVKLLIAAFIFFSVHFPIFAVSQTTIFSPASPTPAIEYSLPYPGILPDHPLYFIKALRDKILLFFTRDPVRRVNINLILSDKRIAMGKVLWEKGNTDLSLTTFVKAEKYLLTASMDLGKLKKQNNLPPGLSDKVELAAKKHAEIITGFMTTVTDETNKQNLNQALGINHQAVQQIQLVK